MSSYTGERRRFYSALQRFVVRFAHLLRTMQVFPEGHPARGASLRSVCQSIDEIIDANGLTGFHVRADRILVMGATLHAPEGMAKAHREVNDWLTDRELGGLELLGRIEEGELTRCLALLEGCVGPERRGRERVNEALVGAGHHALRGLDVEVGEERPAWNADEQVVVVLRAWLRGIRAVERSLERGLSSAVMVELAQVGQALAELTEHQPVRALCLAEPRPVIPFGLRHPVEMAVVCSVVGARLGLPQEARAELAATALMVDVGLRSVPETIRYREDRLDERDQRVYRGHVVEGLVEILRLPHIKPALQRRMLVLFEHHMGVDGQGYPHALRWPETHLYSRIIAVADGYTTLRAEQPGRRALAQDEALAAIQAEAGTRYDPAVVDALATVARAWAAEEEDD